MSEQKNVPQREKMFDPAFQKSFTEAIHKENKIRVEWYLKHGARLRRAEATCAWDDEPDDDDDDFVSVDDMVTKTDEFPAAEGEGTSKVLEAERQMLLKEGAGRKKIKPPAIMKPVSIDVKKLLYKGLSHHGEGRANYLRNRYRLSPENKFNLPVCSSWEYGWTYGQQHELICPEYGRRQVM